MVDFEHESFASQTVVLVPGMYSPRVTMLPMARRLKKNGYRTVIFNHRFLLQTPKQNAERLLALLQQQQSAPVHLLGHSLGGIVIMHVLKMNTELPEAMRFERGRVVLVASPVRGNDLAKRLYSKRGLRLILGRSVVDGVLGGAPDTLDDREVGIISGSARGGLSSLVHKPACTNDGLVNDNETRLENAQDTICVPQSHALMLFSEICTDLAMHFFQHGRFPAQAIY